MVFEIITTLIRQTIGRDPTHSWYIGLTQMPPDERRRAHTAAGDHARRWTAFPPMDPGIAEVVVLHFICNNGLQRNASDALNPQQRATIYVF